MTLELSRRGWLRGLFAALLAWPAGRPAKAASGCAGAPLVHGVTDAGGPTTPLVYSTYLGGQTTTHVYDAAGRLSASIDGAAHTCTYTYDAKGDGV